MEISLADCAKVLRKTNNIVITTHVNPDGDALGSALALYYYLSSIGKQVQILVDDSIPSYLKFLPGNETILRPSKPVEKAGLLIVLDASDLERTGRVPEFVNAKILNIDHHISNTKFSDYWHVDVNAAATGEIILQLLNLEKVKITADIATCLFTAIATDCGFFRFANTTAATFRYAAELVECGIKPNVISEFFTTKSLSCIQTLPNVLDSLEIYQTPLGVKIASLTIDHQLMEKLQNDTDDFINYPRNIEGVEVAVVYKVAEKKQVKVSMRSKNIDVSQIALSFGGGGHARASGYTINGSIESAKEQLVAAVDKHIKKNEKR